MKDVTGRRFGKLRVIGFDRRVGTRYLWDCLCDCGNEKEVDVYRLLNGSTTSCGCYRRLVSSVVHRTHGKSSTPEYMVWKDMQRRCGKSNRPQFKDYGERGIAVCERWSSFENFISDMGPRPGPDYSLGRKKNDVGYTPDNCGWELPVQQQNNRRSNVFLQMDGESHTVTEWCFLKNRSISVVQKRLIAGWSVKRAFGVTTVPFKERRGSLVGSRTVENVSVMES